MFIIAIDMDNELRDMHVETGLMFNSEGNVCDITAATKGLQTSFAYESVTIGNLATSLTKTIYGKTVEFAQLTFELNSSDAVRIRSDGGLPTPTDGHIIYNGDAIILNSPDDVKNFSAIMANGSSGIAIIRVSYMRTHQTILTDPSPAIGMATAPIVASVTFTYAANTTPHASNN